MLFLLEEGWYLFWVVTLPRNLRIFPLNISYPSLPSEAPSASDWAQTSKGAVTQPTPSPLESRRTKGGVRHKAELSFQCGGYTMK